MSKEPQDPNAEQDSWNEHKISLQDIVLSNSWAVQAILNYLEECDPNARERIWRHYELMKRQQDAARASQDGESPRSESSGNGDASDE